MTGGGKLLAPRPKGIPADKSAERLLRDVRALIQSARSQVAQTVNTGLTLLHWHIGKRIREDVLGDERADYGQKIVATVSRQLTGEYGRGFSRDALFRMIQFADRFPKKEIVATLSQQLGWSHFVEFIPVEDQIKRDFYAEMCRLERWSVRTLREKLAGMLYERTALSRKPAKLAALELKKLREEDRLSPDLVFRDPYFLDFLGLKGAYQEKDVEAAILREMEAFILELGAGFTFVARQKRIQVGPDDFYLDLLFFHRKLRRLVAIELKLDKFKPDFKGQMELYLRWLDKHERQTNEKSPLGLILCAGKSNEQVELLKLDKSGIRVAEYMTELPPRPVLENKLREAIHLARERLAAREPQPGTDSR